MMDYNYTQKMTNQNILNNNNNEKKGISRVILNSIVCMDHMLFHHDVPSNDDDCVSLQTETLHKFHHVMICHNVTRLIFVTQFEYRYGK